MTNPTATEAIHPMPNDRTIRRGIRLGLPAVGILAVMAAAAMIHHWLVESRAPRRLVQWGLEAFEAGELDPVVVAADGLRGLPEFEPHVHLLEGMVALRTGRLIEAIQEFGYAKDHPELAGQAYALSGEALYRLRQFRDAERILNQALAIDPQQLHARRYLAMLYCDLGAMTLAEQHLLAVAEAVPTDPRPHRLLGLIHKDYELYQRAVEDYRQSLARNAHQPDAETIRLELAECLVKLRHFDEALLEIQQCGRSGRRVSIEAECRYGQGDRAEASRLVDEALRLAPRDLDALLLKASLQLDAGDTSGAIRTLEEARRYHPTAYRVRYKLTQAYQRAGRSEDAQREAQATKEYRDLITRFADLHQEAIARPDDLEVRYQLGVTAQRLGRPDLAEAWFTVVLAMDPQHAAARQALASLKPQP